MSPDQVRHPNEERLRRAVLPTLEALRTAATGIPSRLLVDALAAIGENFHRPGFYVDDLRRRLGANRWFPHIFQRQFGLSPWLFIQECRMEAATRLLRDTALPVDEISFLIGYLSPCSFHRLCVRWCGLTPGRFRAGLRRVRRPLLALSEEVITWTYWRRCENGELERGEAHRLIEYLESIAVEDTALRGGVAP